MIKRNISKITIYFIISTMVFLAFNKKVWTKKNQVIAWDVIHYYAYLPATFIYNDLTLKFTDNYKGKHKFTIWSKKNKDGTKVLKTTMGMSIMYSPYFLLGHITANILGYDTGGYSKPYKFWLLFGSIFYLFIGLMFLRKILLKYFSEIVTAISLLAIVVGTNLYHYSVFEATMSHSYNFTLFAIFIFLTIKWHEKPNVKYSILIGLTIGLITLIRPTNIIIALFFILWQINSFFDIKEKTKLFLSKYYLILIILIFSIIVIIPQIIYWYKITGSLLYYSYGSDEQFFFSNPQIMRGLFGYRKGWFLYTPIMIFAILGIIFLRKNKQLKHFFVPIVSFLFLNIYVLLSWWSWWYGGGFGLRAFIESYALLIIPFAAFVEWVISKNKRFKIPVLLFVFILILHGAYQTAQYYYGAIHWDSMNKAAYWDSFGRIHPSSNFYNLIKPPDYAKARKGIQATIDNTPKEVKNKQTLKTNILCNVEVLSKDSINLLSIDSTFVFSGVNNISKEYAFSGKNSIKLTKQKQFAFGVTIEDVKPNDKFYCSVKRLGKHNLSFLVVSSASSNFYITNSKSKRISNNSDWEIIELNFKIPASFKENKIKIYIWNKDKKNVYFDDLIITK